MNYTRKSMIEPYFNEMLEVGASDIFITVDCPPSLRVGGKISSMDVLPLKNEDISLIISDILTEDQQEEYASTLELNIALTSENGERFRANIFQQKHSAGIVIRHISSEIPSFEELRLPEAYKKLILEKRGLILLVGSTGSGKSTSLAAMLNYRNHYGDGHIITIEDPIEYIHEHKSCIFTQREIGIDTYSYGIALKNALRQSPDVVVIGEIRDRETMENAMLFCETGHLVVATLHSNNSDLAIGRIVNFFPEELHNQILLTLSQNLKAIVSQRLVETLDEKLVLATEILMNEGLIKILIEEGKIKDIKGIVEKNKDVGMHTFDQCLLDLINDKVISAEVAMQEADNPGNLHLKLNQQLATGISGIASINQTYRNPDGDDPEDSF